MNKSNEDRYSSMKFYQRQLVDLDDSSRSKTQSALCLLAGLQTRAGILYICRGAKILPLKILQFYTYNF